MVAHKHPYIIFYFSYKLYHTVTTILTPDILRLFTFYAFIFVSEAEFHVAQIIFKFTM